MFVLSAGKVPPMRSYEEQPVGLKSGSPTVNSVTVDSAAH